MTSASSNFKGDDKSEQDLKITTFMDNEMLFRWVYSEYHHYVQLNIVNELHNLLDKCTMGAEDNFTNIK